MIVVDSSAFLAVLFDEHDRPTIEAKLLASRTTISAATRVELGIVVEARKGPAGVQLLDELFVRLGTEISPVDSSIAAEALVAWRRYGKGRHPAALNFGDVFAYALARHLGAPLLFTGNDFVQTDIEAA